MMLPRRRVRTAGYLLGASLAGMLDGIVFHQLLGWHHFVQAAGEVADVLVDHLLLRLHALHPQGSAPAWEAGWLAFSVAVLLAGAGLMASASRLRGGIARERRRAGRARRG